MLSDEIDSLGLLKPLQAYNYEFLSSNVHSVDTDGVETHTFSYYAQYSAH